VVVVVVVRDGWVSEKGIFEGEEKIGMERELEGAARRSLRRLEVLLTEFSEEDFSTMITTRHVIPFMQLNFGGPTGIRINR
jgi:hypothetical protein